MKRVVVTGIGSVCGAGNNVSEVWQSVLKGISCANKITRFSAEKFKTKFAVEVKNFKAEDYMDKKDIRKYDLFCHYALASAHQAIIQSKIKDSNIASEDIGVIWGSGNGGISTFDKQMIDYTKNNENPRFSPYFMAAILPDLAPGLIAIQHGFRGINYATVSACASANTAIIEAANNIRNGKAKVMITGGSDAPVTPSCIGGFNACKALSEDNENYLNASKPFDENRKGFVMGEGGAALVLEEMEHAIERGAAIICEYAGGGMSADAYHITQSHPEGLGAILSMKNALKDANLDTAEIGYLNAHATSTPAGDIAEIYAIENVFKKNLHSLHISSTKGVTGHLLGASGAIESIVSIVSLKNQHIPPCINIQKIDERINNQIQIVENKPLNKKFSAVMNNNFGFGGHNSSLIFKLFSEDSINQKE